MLVVSAELTPPGRDPAAGWALLSAVYSQVVCHTKRWSYGVQEPVCDVVCPLPDLGPRHVTPETAFLFSTQPWQENPVNFNSFCKHWVLETSVGS